MIEELLLGFAIGLVLGLALGFMLRGELSHRREKRGS